MEVKIGDVVRLVGGGPLMTVVAITELEGRPPEASVAWFTRAQTASAHTDPNTAAWDGPYENTFSVDALQPAAVER